MAFVTGLVPGLAADTGFEIANRSMLAALALAGVDATPIGFRRHGAAVAPGAVVLGDIHVETSYAPATVKARWLGRAMRLGLPVGAAKYREVPWRVLKAALDAAGPFDAVIVNSAGIGGAYPELFDYAPALLVTHNVEHVTAAAAASTGGSPIMAALYRREAARFAALESELCRRAGFVWCLSEDDRAALNAMAGGHGLAGRSAVMPLIWGAPATQDRKAQPARFDVGLIGTWTWAANRSGLDWFLAAVVPHLPGDMSVAVAGRTPPGYGQAYPRVQWLGRVDDGDQFLADSRVVALTSRDGTGVQLKAIEVLRAGLPCVATTSALRGIDGIPPNIAVSDDAVAYAAALIRQVDLARRGRLPRLDGSSFIAAQLDAQQRAITAALAVLTGR